MVFNFNNYDKFIILYLSNFLHSKVILYVQFANYFDSTVFQSSHM